MVTGQMSIDGVFQYLLYILIFQPFPTFLQNEPLQALRGDSPTRVTLIWESKHPDGRNMKRLL